MFDDDHLDTEGADDSAFRGSPHDFVPQPSGRRRGSEDRPGAKLRACLSCRLILAHDQFYENGCGNCAWLQMDGDARRVADCTTTNFSGFLAVPDPQRSWAARFNNLSDLIPGCYAVSVNGALPDSVKDELQ